MMIEARSHYFAVSTNDLTVGCLGLLSGDGSFWTLVTWVIKDGQKTTGRIDDKMTEWKAMKRAILFLEEMTGTIQ